MKNETKTTGMTANRGQAIHQWIQARWQDGLTVYATTYTKSIELRPKHASAIRVRNGHCEVRQGRRWESINFCRITAR
jgi:hypothetical protein